MSVNEVSLLEAIEGGNLSYALRILDYPNVDLEQRDQVTKLFK